MFHFFTPPHPDCSIVIITIVMLIIAAICRERFIMQGAEWFRCTNSFSLYCNPRGCSHVLFHTQGSQASQNMIQGALVLVAKKALVGGGLWELALPAILKLPSPRLGAQRLGGRWASLVGRCPVWAGPVSGQQPHVALFSPRKGSAGVGR